MGNVKQFNDRVLKYRGLFCFILLLFFQVMVMIYWGNQKLDYQIDEVFSFGSSNVDNYVHNLLGFEDGKINVKSFLEDALLVSSEDRFHYEIAWENQRDDVHPPLYYAVIHTACSLFWKNQNLLNIGLGINIVFFIINQVLLFYLLVKFLKSKKYSFIVCGCIGILPCMVSMVMFFRMYEMVSCFVLCLICIHQRSLEKDKLGLDFYFSCIVVNIMGTLTHYYYLVYLAVTFCVFSIWLLWKHRVKEFWKYLLANIASGIMAGFIFSSIISQIFLGYRGEESFEKMFYLKDFFIRLAQYLSLICSHIMGKYGIIIAVLLMILFCLYRTKVIKNRKIFNKCLDIRYLLLIIPCIGYFAVIAKSAPYIDARYIFPIYYPMLLLLFVGIVKWMDICELKAKSKSFFIIGACLFLLISGYQSDNIMFLFHAYQGALKDCRRYENLDCIYIYDESHYDIQSQYLELCYFASTTFYGKDTLDIHCLSKSPDNEGKIIYVKTSLNGEEVIQTLLSNSDSYSGSKLLNAHSDVNVYLVYK